MILIVKCKKKKEQLRKKKLGVFKLESLALTWPKIIKPKHGGPGGRCLLFFKNCLPPLYIYF